LKPSRSRPEPTNSPSALNLRVKVKEKPTGQFSAGVGYSSYSQVFFSGQVQERNLFGMGYQLGFQGSISAKSADYTVHLLESRTTTTRTWASA
jgi:outer membrane protein insertion porin family